MIPSEAITITWLVQCNCPLPNNDDGRNLYALLYTHHHYCWTHVRSTPVQHTEQLSITNFFRHDFDDTTDPSTPLDFLNWPVDKFYILVKVKRFQTEEPWSRSTGSTTNSHIKIRRKNNTVEASSLKVAPKKDVRSGQGDLGRFCTFLRYFDERWKS